MRLIDADKLIEDYGEVIGCEIDHPKYQDTVREIIDSAPTVCEWIPVSERLPDSDRPVLVTIQWTDFDREVTVGEYWDNPTKAAPESEKGWGTYGDHVTAWREMPEPYKEGTNEGFNQHRRRDRKT